MTNGDRIRAMSNAELAEIIPCPVNIAVTKIRGCPVNENNIPECLKCTMAWLSEEAIV